ncbi:importin beta-like SAD2 homolog isoform X2 [Impatiens glandulifera]|uniref:importin beta-like SAD2 homolog isoform X2 n=1 Tax=Impatiens glandulifera TaxID=253017 RepID=UPI001FB0FC75|nr:importin beta-like SAD2 homolog isoform X2 [Impatiens glandulifera]
MDAHATQHIGQLLNQTLSPDGDVVRSASDALDRLSLLPTFSFSLLSICTGDDPGQRIAAATYLKNFTRRRIDMNDPNKKLSKEFRNALVLALLQAEPSVLKVLVEAFRITVMTEFVKDNSWPELVPQLRSVIENSDLISTNGSCEWRTINALVVLQALLRPFQYFLNPKVAKESVPPQLELITKEIVQPLLVMFHQLAQKVIAVSTNGKVDEKTEKFLLIMCKCIYFSVRSHMPSSLAPVIASLCHDFFGILGSLKFDPTTSLEAGYLLRLKSGKRILLIICALVTRHRKLSDRLLSGIIDSVSRIVKYSPIVSELNFLSERIISLAFDVIAHVLETGPGWRLLSSQFSSMLDSSIFPALVMNQKDISEWEEDPEEYIRKNLPSETEDTSGWREDLFTARKSALNLLGVIAMSKGPPLATSSVNALSSKRKKGERNKQKDRSSMGELLVLPYLSKFPIPAHANNRSVNNYYAVLLSYGSLQDFLSEKKDDYIAALVHKRVLPLYSHHTVPYLIASANWVLGELASCLPEEISTDVYSSLLTALNMPDTEDVSCYPVRASAAYAIGALVENDYLPPDCLPLLQVVVGRIAVESDESSILFQLLSSLAETGNKQIVGHMPFVISSLSGTISKCIKQSPEPWPQVVERGFSALAAMAQCWNESLPEEGEQSKEHEVWSFGQATIAKAFSILLQEAWLRPMMDLGYDVAPLLPPSCIDDSSAMLKFIAESIVDCNQVQVLNIPDLLLVWSDLISNWHAWEEAEDLSIFKCIKETVFLNQRFTLRNFITRDMPTPPAPPVPQHSIVEGIGAFICEAISQYPSALRRASSCIHMLLHIPCYPLEAEDVKKSLVESFCNALVSRFRDTGNEPCYLWKPLLLAISSCYLCYPEIVEKIMKKNENGGLVVWSSALCLLATSSTSEFSLSLSSEIKLSVMALTKMVERLVMQEENKGDGLLHKCFTSLLEALVRMKQVEEGEEEDDEEEEADSDEDGEDSEDEDDEDSEEEEVEETEEQFLERYAKAATDLENGTLLEEGDDEDDEEELELDFLEEFDPYDIVSSLVKRFEGVLVKGNHHQLSNELVDNILNVFPEWAVYFQQSTSMAMER